MTPQTPAHRCKELSSAMGLRVAVALLAIIFCCCGHTGANTDNKWLAQLPWHTRHSMLTLRDHLGLEKLTAAPVPIYRPDLGELIAYWLIRYNDKDFAVLSAGPHTGDYRLIMQGKEPSQLVSLNRQAAAEGKQCLRYVLLTPSPDLNMACDVAGSQIQERPLTGRENIPRMWSDLRKKVESEGVWGPQDPNTKHFQLVSPSHPAFLPLTGSLDYRLRSLGLSNGSDFSLKTLCRLLEVCDESGRVHRYRETAYGEVYVHLQPGEFHPSDTHDLHFEIVAKDVDKDVVVKGFAIQPKHRARRQSSQSTSVFSIDEDNMMPDYNQFSIGSCAVGCGPVAWAQVFGYFDRRGHEPRGNLGSRQLYRCGSDGTTGNDTCEAPPKMAGDTRIQNYIKKMAQILKTFCLGDQGATLQTSMNNVADFFKERQGGNANIQLHTNGIIGFVGVYSDAIRDKALAYLRDKWPVIVGIRVSGILSQHYPVMTKYRQITTSVKTCTQGTSSCTVKDTTEYEMYLHMGWGGEQNGWRKAEMFMAAAARY